MRVSIVIQAPAATIWTVLVDVERWPDWTSTMTSVTWLDAGPTRVGRRARVVQPKLGTAEWTMTELTPERSFTWESRKPGVRTVAGHTLVEQPDGGTLLTLTVDHSGPLAGIARRLTDRLTRDYLETEARGLKERCERP